MNLDGSLLKWALDLSHRLCRYRAYRVAAYLIVSLIVIPVMGAVSLVMTWLATLRFLLIENMVEWYQTLRNEYALLPLVLRAEWCLWKKRNDPE